MATEDDTDDEEYNVVFLELEEMLSRAGGGGFGGSSAEAPGPAPASRGLLLVIAVAFVRSSTCDGGCGRCNVDASGRMSLVTVATDGM